MICEYCGNEENNPDEQYVSHEGRDICGTCDRKKYRQAMAGLTTDNGWVQHYQFVQDVPDKGEKDV